MTGPGEMLIPRAGAIEDLEATKLYLQAIGKGRLLRAEEEVELAKSIEVGLFAKEALEDAALFSRIVEDNFEEWEIAGAMPGEIPEEERASFAADLCRDLPLLASEGDAAKKLFIELNVRLVISIARRREHRYKGLAFLDVIQEGNLGLIHAIEKFDYTKGFKFSTYATWWIIQRMDRGYEEQIRTIRVPMWQIEAKNKVINVEGEFINEHGRAPKLSELAETVGLPEKRVHELKMLKLAPLSLDAPVGDKEGDCLGKLIPDNGQGFGYVEARALEAALRRLMRDKLSEREAKIVELFFGFDGVPRTLQQVGDICDLSDERVRQIKKKALEKLEKYGKHLLEFAT